MTITELKTFLTKQLSAETTVRAPNETIECCAGGWCWDDLYYIFKKTQKQTGLDFHIITDLTATLR